MSWGVNTWGGSVWGQSEEGDHKLLLREAVGLTDTSRVYWPPPTKVDVQMGESGVVISWDKLRDGIAIESYRVYRDSPSTDDYELYTELGPDEDSFTDTHAGQEGTYRYYVISETSVYQSRASNIGVYITGSGEIGFSEAIQAPEPFLGIPLEERLGVSEKDLIYTYEVPPVSLNDGSVIDEYSSRHNPGRAFDLKVESSSYDSDRYTRNGYLADLLRNQGEVLGDYPTFEGDPLYSYVIDVSVSIGDGENHSDLRSKIKKLIRQLPNMHPVGKTGYLYVNAVDHMGQFPYEVDEVREQITGNDYFDDGETFDSDDTFDQGYDLIDPATQEINVTEYDEFDDGDTFDEIGSIEAYYPKRFLENWREYYFDDGEDAFDSGQRFDQKEFVENKKTVNPNRPSTISSGQNEFDLRFDQRESGVYFLIEKGRDV